MDYYSTCAQVITVLILAVTIESKLNSKIMKLNAYDKANFIFFQFFLLTFGVVGLSICLLKLAEFNFFGMQGGKYVVGMAVAYLLIALLVQAWLSLNDMNVFLKDRPGRMFGIIFSLMGLALFIGSEPSLFDSFDGLIVFPIYFIGMLIYLKRVWPLVSKDN